MQQFEDDEREYSEDYPLGGMIEPHDIETEKDMCFNKTEKEKLIEEIYKLEQYELVTTGEPGLALSDVLDLIEKNI